MKRNFASKGALLLFLMSNALFLSSCSSLWSHREQGNANATPTDQTVSKQQYDELARKYQELLNNSKSSVLKPAEVVTANTTTEQAKPEVMSDTTIDPSELVNHIDKAIPDTANLSDGVEALKNETKGQEKGPPIPNSMGVQHVNFTDDVDEQITKLRESSDLIKVNKFENALVLLKDLENSKEKQIVVRAKMMLGDLLFNQGEFDLASQVYEEVVKKYAFSGLVQKALGKLVSCSEKLKQPEKQAKYYSLLHDFFESV